MTSRLSETVTIDLGEYLLMRLDEAAIKVRGLSNASESEKHRILDPLIISFAVLKTLIEREGFVEVDIRVILQGASEDAANQSRSGRAGNYAGHRAG